MDDTFAEAFINRKHTVLGRVLRPFCLWHSLAFELIGSPFGGESASANTIYPADLILAIRICSSRYEPTLSALSAPKSRLQRLRFYFQQWGINRRFSSELLAFFAYLRDFNASPRLFWETENSESAVPWQLALVSRLMCDGGYTEEQAWELPVGKAIWTVIALREAAGQKTAMMTPGEVKALKEAGRI